MGLEAEELHLAAILPNGCKLDLRGTLGADDVCWHAPHLRLPTDPGEPSPGADVAGGGPSPAAARVRPSGRGKLGLTTIATAPA